MITRTERASRAAERGEPPFSNLPRYELRLKAHPRDGYELEIWQLPSPATPRIKAPEYVAALKGAPLRLIEPRILKKLARAKIQLGPAEPGKLLRWTLEEDLALCLGILFRTLAPMKNLDRIREVAEGIDELTREEAAYWLGMAMHRRNPRRVLAALRMLLTTR